MIKIIDAYKRHFSDFGWLKTYWLFSFSSYYDPDNIQFGALRVFNDDVVEPGMGFPTHPHEEMEILSYCVQGKLTHQDNMGNDVTVRAGDIQYMCTGSGIMHAELNGSEDQPLRFIQIWIQPNKKELVPHYECIGIKKHDRLNKWFRVASDKGLNGEFRINQDANIFVSELTEGSQIKFDAKLDRQSYLVCIEGQIHEYILLIVSS